MSGLRHSNQTPHREEVCSLLRGLNIFQQESCTWLSWVGLHSDQTLLLYSAGAVALHANVLNCGE